MDKVWRQRLTAQLLAGPRARSVEQVLARCLAVQSQELRAGRLGVRARSQGLTASVVDAALNDRSAVVSWVNRGTLHLIRAEDYSWLHALTTPQLRTGNARRLGQEGVSPDQAERGVAVVRDVLGDGPATRSELGVALQSKGIPTAGQALVHLLLKATLAGLCVRGPLRGDEQAFVLVQDWLGPQAQVDRDVALDELGARYLAGHGPSSPHDLATWAGITVGDARRALGSRDAPTTSGRLRGPQLLGPWDELLMGWDSRQDVVRPEQQAVITRNGFFMPVVLIDGVAVGTWSIRTREVTAFAPLHPDVDAGVRRELADVDRFLSG